MNQFDILPFELRKLGLTEKEAKTYLASLELVKASAYAISKKVRASRPTVYRILKKLEKKGLVSQTKDGAKNYFTASSPEKLLGILKVKRREAEEQEREFLRIISILQTKYSSTGESTTKVYKGSKSYKNLLEIFTTTPAKEIKIIFIGKKLTPINKEYAKIKNRLRDISIKELHFGKNTNSKDPSYVEKQNIPASSQKSNATIILTDKLIVLRENMGFYTEDKNIKNIMDIVFNTIWR
jgi:sugar-specific transcriptional regulator TrmB